MDPAAPQPQRRLERLHQGALGDRAREDQVAAFRAEYGLDKPVVEQYTIPGLTSRIRS